MWLIACLLFGCGVFVWVCFGLCLVCFCGLGCGGCSAVGLGVERLWFSVVRLGGLLDGVLVVWGLYVSCLGGLCFRLRGLVRMAFIVGFGCVTRCGLWLDVAVGCVWWVVWVWLFILVLGIVFMVVWCFWV